MVKTMAPFAVALVLMLLVGSPALAQFQSDGVSLHAHLNLSELGGASSGNDCWGYTSASGREYALMGVSDKLVVVEVTDPAKQRVTPDSGNEGEFLISQVDGTWIEHAPYTESIALKGEGVFETLRHAAKLVLKSMN